MKKKGIYNITREETYCKGQVVFQEGQPADLIYIVLKGGIEISRNSEGRRVVVSRLEQGEVFGETGLLDGISRNVTARALEETTVGIIDQKDLKVEYDRLSKQFRSLVETIPLRLRKVLDRAGDMSN